MFRSCPQLSLFYCRYYYAIKMPGVDLISAKPTLQVSSSGRKLYRLNEKYSTGGVSQLPIYFTSGRGSHVEVS